MKRLAIIALIVAAGLAIGVYRAKMGAEEAEGRIAGLESEVRQVGEEISVLKAEEAYLSRTERIGPLARDELGLQPASPGQYTAPESLSERLGEERITLPEAGRADATAPAGPESGDRATQ